MFKKIFSYTFLFVLIDQIVKALVSLNMELGESSIIIKDFFNLTYVHNHGAAFSILEGQTWFFILTAIVGLNLIYFYFLKGKELKKYETLLYGVLIAGIIGNLIDRVMYGYVIDYLDFIIFGYDFAIFNLADSFIVVSIIIILIKSFMEEKNGIKSRK